MAKAPSITSNRSFQARLIEAERWRIDTIGACLTGVLITWLIRRWLGGNVASDNAVFCPMMTVLGLAVGSLVFARFEIRERIRRNLGLPG